MNPYHGSNGRIRARTESNLNTREGSILRGDEHTLGFWERNDDGLIDAWSHTTFDGEPISATFPDLQAVVDAFAAGIPLDRRDPADRIRRARALLGLTQTELAAALGLTRDAVARWEAGRNPIPGSVWLALRELARQRDLDPDEVAPIAG